jgi:hypothetical protein
MPRVLTKAKRTRITKLGERGLSLREIQHALGHPKIGLTTIRRVLDQAKVTRPVRQITRERPLSIPALEARDRADRCAWTERLGYQPEMVR